MALGKRYKEQGTFRTDSFQAVDNADGDLIAGVRLLVGDLRDRQDGHVYTDGCWKVTVTMQSGARNDYDQPLVGTPPRSKTFGGESAWSQAASYFDDAVRALRKMSSTVDRG